MCVTRPNGDTHSRLQLGNEAQWITQGALLVHEQQLDVAYGSIALFVQ